MFDMNTLINSTLSVLNMPIAHMSYSGKASAYVMFQFDARKSHHSDDFANARTYDVDLKYWFVSANGDYLAYQIEDLMEEAGFISKGIFDVPHETKYCKALNFVYVDYF